MDLMVVLEAVLVPTLELACLQVAHLLQAKEVQEVILLLILETPIVAVVAALAVVEVMVLLEVMAVMVALVQHLLFQVHL
jgi:hypothetical protein